MTLVAGIDSSTQSCKVLICDATTGEVLREGRADHPQGTEIDPAAWESATRQAIAAAGGLDGVEAVAVGAQQHGMVCLDAAGQVVRPALLWNDVRSADAARALVDELGGPGAWARAVGVVPLAAITVAKLRWLADHEPRHADRTAGVCLPHDWLTWRLRGDTDIAALTTDRSDASGTGYYDAARGDYRVDLLERALRGRRPRLPTVLGPSAGTRSGTTIFGAGLGDNAAAALGLGADQGDVVVSVGTSGVVAAVSADPVRDDAGFVAGFADGTGRYLPLVCTLNGARVLDAAAAMLRVDHDELSALALSAPPGSAGLVLVPYLEGERTPNRPNASGALHGLRVANATPANLARAAVEGLLCALADGLAHLAAHGVTPRRVLLIGGGAGSRALREIAPAVFGVPVLAPAPAQYVALGAARQAAWALSGSPTPPAWMPPRTDEYTAAPTPDVLARYARLRDLTEGA
ncbi:xylulose kinase [Mycobacterium sp. ACS4054]|uniref:FGGY family carbohydrate kinase n=1 Tax=Mycobacterium sp. ACS4054 TaxID=1834119 RepID=UPI0007FD60B3|nr:FGGY family carbohydrate kinase [Mycobacterium sp. ACS4054]OBF06225.1 xylulose kinase [Mycobacterium sp. ACS4054]